MGGLRSFADHRVRPIIEDNETAKSIAKWLDLRVARTRHSIANYLPAVVRPTPRDLTVAVTAHCNLRCKACRYGRDFMVGQRLSLDVISQVLADARSAGIASVRFYGGEPLLHPDLVRMVGDATSLGLRTSVNTNGTHLAKKIDALYAAGLHLVTVGFYGVGEVYDSYTQREGHFRRLEESLRFVRARYGSELELQLNFTLMRSSCNLTSLAAAWQFARQFDMYFHIDLISYSLPFFVQGEENEFHLKEEDGPEIESVVSEFLHLKQQEPARFLHSPEFLRSIPDWLQKKSAMKVPCDAYEMIWIGADGTVQLCDTALPLGNVNQTPLREILFGKEHRCAARDAFLLNCPNCMCRVESRIQKDLPSLRRYHG
jgi:MoaA/NifB/PqqE/SkfB family radical SAM enzyme